MRDYDRMLSGEVPLEAGWRVYSSGPGLFLEMLTQRLLGIRHAGDEIEIDPVVDPALGVVTATLPLLGRSVRVEIRPGERGYGVRSVTVDGVEVAGRELDNPYRDGGVTIPADAIEDAGTMGVRTH